MPGTARPSVRPAPGERGLASWAPEDLAGVLLPAWDDFLDVVEGIDLDGPSRTPGMTARDVCVHLGSWPGTRSLHRMRQEAERDDLDVDDHRAGTFDQESHNEAVLEAWSKAPRTDILAALREAREETAAFLASDEPASLGRRTVRSVLGPLPLSTLVAAVGYELAVHSLDLAPAGAREPSPALLTAGLAALVDTTGALASRTRLTARAACLVPEGGWAFSAAPEGWTTLELPEVPESWPRVEGSAATVLDASSGRRPVPPMLAKRDLRLHHVTGLLALTPLVETVPGLPGGPALRMAVRNVRAVNRLVRRLPGVPG